METSTRATDRGGSRKATPGTNGAMKNSTSGSGRTGRFAARGPSFGPAQGTSTMAIGRMGCRTGTAPSYGPMGASTWGTEQGPRGMEQELLPIGLHSG